MPLKLCLQTGSTALAGMRCLPQNGGLARCLALEEAAYIHPLRVSCYLSSLPVTSADGMRTFLPYARRAGGGGGACRCQRLLHFVRGSTLRRGAHRSPVVRTAQNNATPVRLLANGGSDAHSAVRAVCLKRKKKAFCASAHLGFFYEEGRKGS